MKDGIATAVAWAATSAAIIVGIIYTKNPVCLLAFLIPFLAS